MATIGDSTYDAISLKISDVGFGIGIIVTKGDLTNEAVLESADIVILNNDLASMMAACK